MSHTAEEELRQARQVHARFLIDVAADPEHAARYDLPPALGFELQYQIVNALASLPYLAGAETSVQDHQCAPPQPAVVEPEPEGPPRILGDLARLRARILHEAADILDACWHPDNGTPTQLLREFAWSWGSDATPEREAARHSRDRQGTSQRQLVELLALADPEQLRALALQWCDEAMSERAARQEAESRAEEARVQWAAIQADRDRMQAAAGPAGRRRSAATVKPSEGVL